MSKLARILVGLGCNYSCDYCCNKTQSHLFRPLKEFDASKYDIVGVSGGEPLISCNVDMTRRIIRDLREHGKFVVLYTNLSVPPPDDLLRVVDGWTIGYHPSQTDLESFISRVKDLKHRGAKSIRVKVEDKHLVHVSNWLTGVDIVAYTMNECDRSEVEDIFLIKDGK